MSYVRFKQCPCLGSALVRLFHWILFVSFCLAYFSEGEVFEKVQDRLDGELLQTMHVWAGYTIAGLLLFRLLWGFVGPQSCPLQ
jgi:cytochrome b